VVVAAKVAAAAGQAAANPYAVNDEAGPGGGAVDTRA
jgi:hypothetical protein